MDDVPNPLNLRLGWTDFNYFSFPNAQKTSINDLKMEADRRQKIGLRSVEGMVL